MTPNRASTVLLTTSSDWAGPREGLADASCTGSPSRSTRPPNATAQSANHVHPRRRPPITSDVQCAPRNTREQPTATAIPAAVPPRIARMRGDDPRESTSATAAQVAAAAVAWPLGNEGPDSTLN